MLLGPRPWIFSNSSAVGGYFSSISSRRSKLPRCSISCEHGGDAFADAGNVGDLLLGVFEDRRHRLGIAFDHRRGVAIAADAEAILAGDLHQVGGFGKQAGDLAIFHYLILAAGGYPILAAE